MAPVTGLGPVKPHVKAAAEEIGGKFGITRIGGFATTGHVANSDHYKGLALDVPARGAKGTMIAEWAIANAQRLAITYVIWNRRIYDFRKDNPTWKSYVGTSPHTDHVHISFSAQPGSSGGSAGNDNVANETVDDQLKGCIGQLLGFIW